MQGITAQVDRFFQRGAEYVDVHGGYPASIKGKEKAVEEVKVVNNLEWFKGVTLLDFLRDVGKLAKVNVMIARDR